MTPKQIATICHYANKGVCEAFDDYSQKDWEDAEHWQREAAIEGVHHHLANPDLPASASHNAWMAKKLADGWVYGEVKDSVKKTHPDLTAFENLDEAGQIKDIIFASIVDKLRNFVRE